MEVVEVVEVEVEVGVWAGVVEIVGDGRYSMLLMSSPLSLLKLFGSLYISIASLMSLCRKFSYHKFDAVKPENQRTKNHVSEK